MFKEVTYIFDSNYDLKTCLGKFLLPVGIVVYWAILITYYPNFYSAQDEYLYLSKAYHYANIITPKDGWIEKYPPGQSIMLSLLIRLGDNYVYLLNPILLTALALLFARYLKKFNLPNYYALILLFNPTFFLFSRTIMSDIPAVLFFFLGLNLAFDKNKIILGWFLIGFSISIRLAYIPLVICIIIYFLLKSRPKQSIIFKILIGLILGLIPLYEYLYSVLNSSSFGYSHDFSNIKNNLLIYLPNFLKYFISLNLIYPLLLIIGFFFIYKNDGFLKLISVLPFLYMPLMPQPADPSNQIMLIFVLLQRYFFSSIFCLLIGYIFFIHRYLTNSVLKFLPLFMILTISCLLVSIFHQKYLNDKIALNEKIYKLVNSNSIIISDDRLVKFLSPKNDKPLFINLELINKSEAVFKKIEMLNNKRIYLIFDEENKTESTLLINKILKKYSFKKITKFRNYIFYVKHKN